MLFYFTVFVDNQYYVHAKMQKKKKKKILYIPWLGTEGKESLYYVKTYERIRGTYWQWLVTSGFYNFVYFMACMYRDLAQGRRAPSANILQRLGTSARGRYLLPAIPMQVPLICWHLHMQGHDNSAWFSMFGSARGLRTILALKAKDATCL